MNTTAAAIAAALTFTWLGMVLAISFLEAPLKFRAPGVTIPVGLGIGRLVFRALNSAEAVLAVVIAIAVFAGRPTAPVLVLALVAIVLLAVQLAVVRPLLSRRSDLVLEGAELHRSRAHLWYVATESVKVIVLIALGVSLLAR
jgi:hypothetical protein